MHSPETGQPDGQREKSSNQKLPQGSRVLLPAETPHGSTAAAATRSQVYFSHILIDQNKNFMVFINGNNKLLFGRWFPLARITQA